MSTYLIGDIQGCDDALGHLLNTLDFSASRDTVYLLGDLVNRGPDSDAVIRRCMTHGDAMRCLLGNHDLHLLAVASGARAASPRDTLDTVLQAPDSAALLDWLRHQPLARTHSLAGETLLMVHAGVLPDWTAEDVLTLAGEVQAALHGNGVTTFFKAMYGNTPDRWQSDLSGMDRLRTIVNALTRLRFCAADGAMDFASHEGASNAPDGLVPWFDVPGRRTATALVAFGHWSTLGLLQRPHLLGLDTGCVWGGCLSAVRLGSTLAERELIQVKCRQEQAPGA